MEIPLAGHYRKIKLILGIILMLNWFVAAAKIAFGLRTGSASMTADGFHSLADGASNILGLIGIYLASQPTDKGHPYGHKKYETLFSLAIATLLFVVSFNIVKDSIGRFRSLTSPEVTAMSFAVMLVTMAINLWVCRYEHAQGRRLHSDILVSDSLHTRADLFTSFSVIVSLIVIRLGYPLIDPIVSILIAFFIAWAGWNIFKRSSDVLCDSAAVLDEQLISSIVTTIEGVQTCHKIRSRGREDDIHIDLHVQVAPQMSMKEAHRISYSIEEALKAGIPGVSDVVVHMEPRDADPE